MTTHAHQTFQLILIYIDSQSTCMDSYWLASHTLLFFTFHYSVMTTWCGSRIVQGQTHLEIWVT